MVAGIALRAQPSQADDGLGIAKVWHDTLDGIRFLRENSIASAMTGGIVIAFGAVGAVLALGPVFVQVTLGAGPSGWGLVVAAFGVGMGLGMATAGQAAKVVERETVFVWSLIAAAVALFVLATMPNLSWAIVFTVWLGAFCGLAWVSGYTLLQENVVDEYRGRTFGALTTMSRMVLFLSLAAFPDARADLPVGRAGGRLPRSSSSAGSASTCRARGSALWVAGGLVVGAGLNTRRLLTRYRLSRPVPLTLVPKLKRPPATGLFIAFEGVEGAGKGTQIGMAEEFLRSARSGRARHPGAGRDQRSGSRSATWCSTPRRADWMLAPRPAVRGVPRADRGQRDPAGARRGQGGDLRSLRRFLARVPGVGVAASANPTCCRLNVWATQGLFPDMVILLHVEPEIGLARGRRNRLDRMEQEGEAFLAKVADAYLEDRGGASGALRGGARRPGAGGGVRRRARGARAGGPRSR